MLFLLSVPKVSADSTSAVAVAVDAVDAVSVVASGVIAVAGCCCFFSFFYVFLFLSVSFLYLLSSGLSLFHFQKEGDVHIRVHSTCPSLKLHSSHRRHN